MTCHMRLVFKRDKFSTLKPYYIAFLFCVKLILCKIGHQAAAQESPFLRCLHHEISNLRWLVIPFDGLWYE